MVPGETLPGKKAPGKEPPKKIIPQKYALPQENCTWKIAPRKIVLLDFCCF